MTPKPCDVCSTAALHLKHIPFHTLFSFQSEIRSVLKSFPSKFIVDKNLPSAALLSDWINRRAEMIFEESALVDHALALLHCAQINGNFRLPC